jgi:hypothetical protein
MSVSVQVVALEGTCVVQVRGAYGSGSEGNPHASLILDALKEALAGELRSVLVDLSAMTYEWGDALGGVFLHAALHEEPQRVSFLLNRDSAQAYEGLLSMCGQLCEASGLRERIRFSPPPSGAPEED